MSKEAATLHRQAAEHYAAAALAHTKAAQAYTEGDDLQAAHWAIMADAHAAHAEESKLDAYKEHLDEHADELSDGEVHG